MKLTGLVSSNWQRYVVVSWKDKNNFVSYGKFCKPREVPSSQEIGIRAPLVIRSVTFNKKNIIFCRSFPGPSASSMVRLSASPSWDLEPFTAIPPSPISEFKRRTTTHNTRTSVRGWNLRRNKNSVVIEREDGGIPTLSSNLETDSWLLWCFSYFYSAF